MWKQQVRPKILLRTFFLPKRQLNTQVLGLGYPQGEQTLSQALIPILSNI